MRIIIIQQELLCKSVRRFFVTGIVLSYRQEQFGSCHLLIGLIDWFHRLILPTEFID
jgi:hypothetical protein